MADEILICAGGRYRAKRPRVNKAGFVNDRAVRWVIGNSVKYADPNVKEGHEYPVTTIDEFREWMGADVSGTHVRNPPNAWDTAEDLAEWKEAQKNA